MIGAKEGVRFSMASDRSFAEYIVDQLSGSDGIAYRYMMGEYILYFRGRIFGGIYNDRLLVKPVPAALRLLPDAPRELPYHGGREMLLVENVDDREFLSRLVTAMYDELPEPKKKR